MQSTGGLKRAGNGATTISAPKNERLQEEKVRKDMVSLWIPHLDLWPRGGRASLEPQLWAYRSSPTSLCRFPVPATTSAPETLSSEGSILPRGSRTH